MKRFNITQAEVLNAMQQGRSAAPAALLAPAALPVADALPSSTSSSDEADEPPAAAATREEWLKAPPRERHRSPHQI